MQLQLVLGSHGRFPANRRARPSGNLSAYRHEHLGTACFRTVQAARRGESSFASANCRTDAHEPSRYRDQAVFVPEPVLLWQSRPAGYRWAVLLLAFIGLQMMDALTTVVFLHLGVQEGNPLIRAALADFATPELALALPKIVAVALGLLAWRSGRMRLLRTMNVLFALCVAWNVVAICSATTSF